MTMRRAQHSGDLPTKVVNDPGPVEPAPELPPPPPPPPPAKVATGRIGDKLTVNDRSGKAQFEVTVTRLKSPLAIRPTNPSMACTWARM